MYICMHVCIMDGCLDVSLSLSLSVSVCLSVCLSLLMCLNMCAQALVCVCVCARTCKGKLHERLIRCSFMQDLWGFLSDISSLVCMVGITFVYIDTIFALDGYFLFLVPIFAA